MTQYVIKTQFCNWALFILNNIFFWFLVIGPAIKYFILFWTLHTLDIWTSFVVTFEKFALKNPLQCRSLKERMILSYTRILFSDGLSLLGLLFFLNVGAKTEQQFLVTVISSLSDQVKRATNVNMFKNRYDEEVNSRRMF